MIPPNGPPPPVAPPVPGAPPAATFPALPRLLLLPLLARPVEIAEHERREEHQEAWPPAPALSPVRWPTWEATAGW